MPQLIKYILLVLIGIASSSYLYSQRPQWSGAGKQPIKGIIQGQILDLDDGTPISYAQITAFSTLDSTEVAGALTDSSGRFQLIDIPRGSYRLRIVVFGQTKVSGQTYEIDAAGVVVDLGVLRLRTAAATTEEVTVEADASDMIIAPDRRIYNIDQMPTAVGGTATDVLQNIPSVTVDIDGNVELRGSSNVVIWIDGKPSGLTSSDRGAILQMVPAALIERIEVITNPSSKYDAEGQAGIINIITKRGALVGTNGNVELSAGTREKYNGSVFLNKRTVNYNLSGSYSYRNDYRYSEGYSRQTTLLPDSSFRYISNADGWNRGDFHSLRVGLDLFLTPTQTLSLTGNGTIRATDEKDNTRYTYETLDGFIYDGFSRVNDEVSADRNYGIDAEYKHTFPGSDKQWSALASFGRNYGKEDLELTDDVLTQEDYVYQYNQNEENFTTAVAQTDFLLPFPGNKRLEFGLKGTLRINDRDVVTQTLDTAALSYFTDARNTDRFTYTEQVYAAYTQYSGKLNFVEGLEFSVGVRGEQTFTLGESQTLVQDYSQSYFNLFPSAFIKYTLQPGSDIILNYSRRVSRPRLQALNPFTDYSDTLNLRKGNPNLQPEYTDSYEFSINQVLGSVTVSGTAFYRYTTGATSNFRTIDSNGVGTNTWLNLDTGENLGLEGLVRMRFGARNFVVATFNGFYSRLNGEDVDNSGFNWNARLIATLGVSKTTQLQITGFYFHPFVRAQGTIGGFSSVNAALKQELFKRKLIVTLNVSDVFDIRRFEMTSDDTQFSYEGWRKRESRIGTLSLSYRFGTQTERRQQMPGRGQNGGDGAGQGGGDFEDFKP